MNKTKSSITAASRVLLNVFLVIAMVVLASLIGVGGAALWIYGRPVTAESGTKRFSPRLKTDVATAETRAFPRLSPVQSDNDAPTRLTPARYMPTDAEIATLSDTPRYTHVSYNGGRQQAHLRVNTVLSTSVPAPLTPAAINDDASAQTSDRPPLTDSASRYITDSRGRVIGIDGSAGAAQEALEQRVNVARALPVQAINGTTPEVRVAYPVTTRKALPVDADAQVLTGFDVQAELRREDDFPVLHAQPVARTSRFARTTMLGASDDFRSFERN